MSLDLREGTGNRFEIYKNSTATKVFTAFDEAGQVLDLSAWTTPYIKVSESTAIAALFDLAGSWVTDGTDGKISFAFTPTQLTTAGTYTAQVRVEDSAALFNVIQEFTFVIKDTSV